MLLELVLGMVPPLLLLSVVLLLLLLLLPLPPVFRLICRERFGLSRWNRGFSNARQFFSCSLVWKLYLERDGGGGGNEGNGGNGGNGGGCGA